MKNNFFINSFIWRINLIKNFLKKYFLKDTIEFFLIKKILKNHNKFWILDIGANIGQKTDLFLSANQNINVILFEPYKKYFLHLKKKFKNKKNVKAHNFGIGRIDQKQKFYITDDKKNSEAYSYKKMPYHNSFIRSNIKKLDNIRLLKDKQILLIKIDVEQLEFDVMIGGNKLLLKNRPFLLFETTNKNINKIKTFLQKINSHYMLTNIIFLETIVLFLRTQLNHGKLIIL